MGGFNLYTPSICSVILQKYHMWIKQEFPFKKLSELAHTVYMNVEMIL